MSVRLVAAILALLLVTLHAEAIEVGERMPLLTAAGFGPESKPVDLRAYKGKVVYVDFWASWCVPCRTSMPALETLYKKHSDRGFVVVGVNKDDRLTDAQRFLARFPATFPQATDADEKVVKAFTVTAMPIGYLVDRKGVVRHVHTGFTNETAATLEREVEALLKEAP